MVATFKGSQHRRRSTMTAETELQTPLEDLMFSPYKRRKLQKQKEMQAADLAKLRQAAQYFDMIDNVKLETTSTQANQGEENTVAASSDEVSSASSTPSTTPVKQPRGDSVHDGSDTA